MLAALKRLCPDGINTCFDNVGGETLEPRLGKKERIEKDRQGL